MAKIQRWRETATSCSITSECRGQHRVVITDTHDVGSSHHCRCNSAAEAGSSLYYTYRCPPFASLTSQRRLQTIDVLQPGSIALISLHVLPSLPIISSLHYTECFRINIFRIYTRTTHLSWWRSTMRAIDLNHSPIDKIRPLRRRRWSRRRRLGQFSPAAAARRWFLVGGSGVTKRPAAAAFGGGKPFTRSL